MTYPIRQETNCRQLPSNLAAASLSTAAVIGASAVAGPTATVVASLAVIGNGVRAFQRHRGLEDQRWECFDNPPIEKVEKISQEVTDNLWEFFEACSTNTRRIARSVKRRWKGTSKPKKIQLQNPFKPMAKVSLGVGLLTLEAVGWGISYTSYGIYPLASRASKYVNPHAVSWGITTGFVAMQALSCITSYEWEKSAAMSSCLAGMVSAFYK